MNDDLSEREYTIDLVINVHSIDIHNVILNKERVYGAKNEL